MKLNHKIDSNNFRCPFCKSKLFVIGIERIETLIDHVCNPNGIGSMQDIYACSNKKCESNNEESLIRWDWFGDLYMFGKNYKKFNELSNSVINNAPYGTTNRKTNIEIYKKGLKKRMIEVWPKWYLFNFGFFIEYKYTADYEGNVLSKKRRLQLLKKSNIGATYYIPGIITYFRFLKKFKNDIKEMNKGSKYALNALKKSFEPLPKWDKRLWHRAFKWTIHTFYKNIYKLTLDKK